jgi:hypothetical protein
MNSTSDVRFSSAAFVMAAAANRPARHGSDPADREIVRIERMVPLLNPGAGVATFAAMGLGADGAQLSNAVTNRSQGHNADLRTTSPYRYGSSLARGGVTCRTIVAECTARRWMRVSERDDLATNSKLL